MAMSNEQYLRIWGQLTDELESIRDITTARPLLAHYTSMQVVDSFLKEGKIWLSNPLNMNDHQEVGFGVHMAINLVNQSEAIRHAFANDEMHRLFLGEIGKLYDDYGTREVKDLFIACFSEHENEELPDGKLSMWRGYGDFGNGAAIVLDTSKIELKEKTPFILSEVTYRSNQDREIEVAAKVEQLAEIIRSEDWDHDNIPGLAHVFFRRAVLAALFTKHIGFDEEKEWRLAYMPDFDHDAEFKGMIDYHIGPAGLEPKLKLALEAGSEIESMGYDLNELIHAIVIGPRTSTPPNLHAAETMLRKLGRESLLSKLRASTIPFRP